MFGRNKDRAAFKKKRDTARKSGAGFAHTATNKKPKGKKK